MQKENWYNHTRQFGIIIDPQYPPYNEDHYVNYRVAVGLLEGQGWERKRPTLPSQRILSFKAVGLGLFPLNTLLGKEWARYPRCRLIVQPGYRCHILNIPTSKRATHTLKLLYKVDDFLQHLSLFRQKLGI